MKQLSLGLLALGLLTAPFAAYCDVQITSFEDLADPSDPTYIDPWITGPGTNSVGAEILYQITDSDASDGTHSLEIVYPMEGTTGTWGQIVSFPTDLYASTIAQGTGIQADVYFDWSDRPAATSGGPWYGLALILNSTNTGWVEIDPTSGGLTEGQWKTLFFPMTAEQAAQVAASGQSTSAMGFRLGGGTWGGAPMGGNMTLRFDNIVVVGASASGPAAPTDLVGTPVLGGANLTWTASADALTYTIKRRASLTGSYETIATDLTTTSYSDSGLLGNVTYYYVVTASNADGESSFSIAASVTTPSDEVLLSSFETELSPWMQGPEVTWDNPDTTDVNESVAPTYSLTTAGATEGATSAEVSVPMTYNPGFTFYSVNVSDYRNTIAQSKGIVADVYVEWVDRPAGTGTGGTWFSTDLNLSYNGVWTNIGPSRRVDLTDGWQTLTWDLPPERIAAMTANENTYSSIGFSLSSGFWGDATSSGGTMIIRIDNVRVTGFRETAVPAAPTGLIATAGTGQIDLSWDATDTATGYNVMGSTEASGPYYTVAKLGNVTSYSNTGLADGTTYYYTIVAVNAGGEGPASAEASATTEGVAATGISAWRQMYFGTSEATGDAANDADPDGDGISNLLEYATGGNPNTPDGTQIQTLTTVDGYLTLSFKRIADATLTYEVEASDDLVDWGTSPIWSSTGAENTEGLVTVTDTELQSAHARRFLRLRVTAP